jgi:hypothetical protein
MLEIIVGLLILLFIGFLIFVPILAIVVFIWLRRRKRKKALHQSYPHASPHFKTKRHYSGSLIDISDDQSFESGYQFSNQESYAYADSSGNENWQTGSETSNSWDWSSSSSDSSSSDSGWSSSDSGSSSDSSSSSSD